MKLSPWWKDAIAKVVFLYIVFQFLQQCYTVYLAFSTSRSPLVPDFLPKYIAFPHYFLIFYWGVGVVLFYKFTKDKKLQQTKFWTIPVSLAAFLIGAFLIYLLLIKMNPYG